VFARKHGEQLEWRKRMMQKGMASPQTIEILSECENCALGPYERMVYDAAWTCQTVTDLNCWLDLHGLDSTEKISVINIINSYRYLLSKEKKEK